VLRRYAFTLWIPVFIGSVFILNGASPRLEPVQLSIGLALTLVPMVLGLYLAIGPWPGHPRPSLLARWFLGGTALVYLVLGAAALVWLDGRYAAATVLAGAWPLTAVALWIATARSKTVADGGRARDASVPADDDPAPGMGVAEERPLGDSPELHDEISPHDLPKDHPGRRTAEKLAARGDGTVRRPPTQRVTPTAGAAPPPPTHGRRARHPRAR
jgi:hypothetical protein